MDEPTYIVRRLTPVECERLQGYPDNFTLIGEPETVTVTDYEYEYDDDGNVTKKTPIGEHEELEWYYTDENGKRKKCADSARYKALGNSICLPYWRVLFANMAKHLPEDATLGSLFDGIGGFPLCWEEIHGKGTARWASEIEAFPIAVTKLRFPEPDGE